MKQIINEPSTDFHIRLNEQCFSIPTEILKKNLHKLETVLRIQTEEINNQLSKINELFESNTIENDKQAVIEINKMIKRVDLLEKQLFVTKNREMEILMRIKARIEFFKELEYCKQQNSRDRLIEWYQRYTNLLIGDYLVRNSTETMSKGADDTDRVNDNIGSLFLKQQQIENLLDYDVIINANMISNALIDQHDLSPLIAWIHDNNQYLKDVDSTLHFDARLQEYIQLLSTEKFQEAIQCFQLHLFKFISTHPNEIQQAAGFLLYYKAHIQNGINTVGIASQNLIMKKEPVVDSTSKIESLYMHFFNKKLPTKPKEVTTETNNPNRKIDIINFMNLPQVDTYSKLFDEKRWKNLNDLFLNEYYQMYGISKNDPLLIYLSLGISSLKTKDCLHKKEVTTTENERLDTYLNSEVILNKCPVCSNEFRNISKDMPYAHHIQSVLYENPIMLPNGNVYDKIKLEQLADHIREKELTDISAEQVIDPIDKQVYMKSCFVKMYPT